jgi:hypothetical protein
MSEMYRRLALYHSYGVLQRCLRAQQIVEHADRISIPGWNLRKITLGIRP